MSRTSLFGLLFLVLFCSLVFCEEDSNVIELNYENFDEYIAQNDHVLVEFYAPWCGHCKKLVPEYEKLASECQDLQIVIAKLDATQNEQIGSEQNITGYPTLILYSNGQRYQYTGSRTADSLYKWLKAHVTSHVIALTSLEQMKTEFFATEASSHIVYFARSETDPVIAYLTPISKNPDFVYFMFGYYVDSNIIAAMGYEPGRMATFLKNGEIKVINVQDDISEEELSQKLINVAYPSLETLLVSEEFFSRIASKKSPLVVFFHNNDSTHMSWFQQISEELNSMAIFAESASDTYPKLASSWGASGNVFPTALIVLWEETMPVLRAWDEEKQFTFDALKSWVDGCLKNQSCPTWKKSQPIPTENVGPVRTLVGKNFDQVVFDANINVLVEFYAPWCGYCKKLEPIYESLAQDLQTYKDKILIAKIDASENTVDVNIQKFPTIMLYKTTDKLNPIIYNGNRTKASFIEFINTNTDMDIEVFNDDDLEHQNDEL